MNNIHLAFLHRISSLPVLSDASELILILYLQSLILSLYYPPEVSEKGYNKSTFPKSIISVAYKNMFGMGISPLLSNVGLFT